MINKSLEQLIEESIRAFAYEYYGEESDTETAGDGLSWDVKTLSSRISDNIQSKYFN